LPLFLFKLSHGSIQSTAFLPPKYETGLLDILPEFELGIILRRALAHPGQESGRRLANDTHGGARRFPPGFRDNFVTGWSGIARTSGTLQGKPHIEKQARTQ
jgi:hypothetical protein